MKIEIFGLWVYLELCGRGEAEGEEGQRQGLCVARVEAAEKEMETWIVWLLGKDYLQEGGKGSLKKIGVFSEVGKGDSSKQGKSCLCGPWCLMSV